jgi:hypothetical protein
LLLIFGIWAQFQPDTPVSENFKEGYTNGYIVGRADRRDSIVKSKYVIDRLAKLHAPSDHVKSFEYVAAWKIGYKDGYNGRLSDYPLPFCRIDCVFVEELQWISR